MAKSPRIKDLSHAGEYIKLVCWEDRGSEAHVNNRQATNRPSASRSVQEAAERRLLIAAGPYQSDLYPYRALMFLRFHD